MTVPATTRRAGPFLGNGAATSFPFTFKCFDATELQVAWLVDGVESTLVKDSDYTVTLNADQDASPGGTITYPITGSPLAIGEALTIAGDVPYSQALDLPPGGNFSPIAVENAMDRTVMQIQQLAEENDRSVRLPLSAAGTNVVLPMPEPSLLLGWNADADALQNYDASTLATLVAYGTAKADVFTADGVQTSFTLSASPGVLANLDVAVGGVTQLPTVDYSFVGTTLTFTSAPPAGAKILARYMQALAQGYGTADTVNFTQSGTGAVTRTVEAKLRDTLSLAEFVTDNTGATDVSVGMSRFLNEWVASKRPAHIPAGIYKFEPLTIDTPFVDAALSDLTTDGADAVIFKRASATNAPMLRFTNGTATSGVGKYWRGGRIGGFTVDQNGQAKAAGQHGVALRGVWGMVFEKIKVNDAGGSGLYIEPALYGGTNPDPYAVTMCEFDVEANRCDGWVVQNDNYVGLNLCRFRNLRGIECKSGGFFGFGAGNRVDKYSFGSCKGWAFDDGTNAAATGGAPSRMYVGPGEVDDCQYGFRINRTTGLVGGGLVRFVHRYNFGPLNPGEGYWPRAAVVMAGGASPSSANVTLDLWHRIEAGGSKSDVGVFVNGSSNGNLIDVTIDQRISDNAGFGFADTDLYTGLSAISTITLTRDRNRIADTTIPLVASIYSDGSTQIGNSGWGTATAKVTLPTALINRASMASSGNVTVPMTRVYRVRFRFSLAMADGTRVRFGVMRDRGGTLTIVAAAADYSETTNPNSYEITAFVDCNAGDVLYPIATQDTAGAISVSTVASHLADNVFTVEAI